MNIFFDMDYTLLAVDGSLRPGVRELLERLREDGHQAYVWSGNGIRWLELRRHGLESLVVDCFEKPMHNYAEKLERLGLPVKPDLVVDDHLEVAAALGGIWVRSYYFAEKVDDAKRAASEYLEQIRPDLVIAGPAFDAGRYGLACAEVCRLAKAKGDCPL